MTDDRTWTAADPLFVDPEDEPWTVVEDQPLARHRSRDLALACLAGCVILALLAWGMGR